MVFEYILIFGTAVIIILFYRLIYRLHIFNVIFEREVFEGALTTFKILMFAMIFYLFYHVGEIIENEAIENISMTASIIIVIFGVAFMSNKISNPHKKPKK